MMVIDETSQRGDGQGLANAVVGVESFVQTLIGTPRREGLQPILDTVLAGALRVVPGARSATALLLDRRQQIAARASSDPAAAESDDLQVALGEGPTLEAAFSSTGVGSTNLHRAVAWPRWSAHAAGVAYTAALAVPLQGQLLGGALTFYRTPDDVALDEPMARLVACAAAMALDHAVDVSGLARALETRDAIGQAKGILVERLSVDADQAFALLVSASQATNIKLRDVAAWLTRSATAASPDQTPYERPSESGHSCDHEAFGALRRHLAEQEKRDHGDETSSITGHRLRM
ncbi:GAF and ANTAR domain-containing protein [Actinomycetospora sp. CA-053990]|uniref:GAF and ANTAR domain-containing protein n=1 Tax=Actinomycetospora sp. CA-053990 TaxID=3239891 RepID=UPI003D91F769